MLMLAILAVVMRFVIRIRRCKRHQQQRRFSIEGGFLVFGLACAIVLQQKNNDQDGIRTRDLYNTHVPCYHCTTGPVQC